MTLNLASKLSMPASEEKDTVMAQPPTATFADGMAEDLLRVVDAAGDGLLVLDREWLIVFANESARRISRIEPRHLNGPSYWELYPAVVGTELERAFERAMKERLSLAVEFFYEPFAIWMALRAAPATAGIAVFFSRHYSAEACG